MQWRLQGRPLGRLHEGLGPGLETIAATHAVDGNQRPDGPYSVLPSKADYRMAGRGGDWPAGLDARARTHTLHGGRWGAGDGTQKRAALRPGRPLGSAVVEYTWRGRFASEEVEQLHAEAFGREADYAYDWVGQVERHSLGWACARQGPQLLGWVNVAWDGLTHAFLVDTIVSAEWRRDGIGTALVKVATEAARDAGCEWLHVDFEGHLEAFYFEACGFAPTNAGLIAL
jgi:GNAT superfamily N-acetyltransferase